MALMLGRPRLLLYGSAVVLASAVLIFLAARRGTAGWLAAGVLLMAAAFPERFAELWPFDVWNGALHIVLGTTLVLVAVAWLGRMAAAPAGRSNPLALPQILLLMVALVGIVLRSGEYATLERPIRALARMFIPMLALGVVASSRMSKRQAVAFAGFMVVVGALVALVGLRYPLQLWRSAEAGFLFGSVSHHSFRTISSVGGAGLTAMALAMMLPVALALAMQEKRWWRALWVLCALLYVVAIALSISRTGIIAAICAMLLFGWLNRALLRRRFLVFAAAVAVLVGLVTLVVVNYRDYTNFARVTKFLDPDNASDRLRITSAKAAFEVGSSRPVLGSGIARFYPRDAGNAILVEGIPSARDPHSLYLLALAEMGVPGLLLVLWLVWRPALDFLREGRRADRGTALLLSAFACSALAMGIYSIMSSALFVHFRVATAAWWTVGLGYQFVGTRSETRSK
jgi:O-antigen ligase